MILSKFHSLQTLCPEKARLMPCLKKSNQHAKRIYEANDEVFGGSFWHKLSNSMLKHPIHAEFVNIINHEGFEKVYVKDINQFVEIVRCWLKSRNKSIIYMSLRVFELLMKNTSIGFDESLCTQVLREVHKLLTSCKHLSCSILIRAMKIVQTILNECVEVRQHLGVITNEIIFRCEIIGHKDSQVRKQAILIAKQMLLIFDERFQEDLSTYRVLLQRYNLLTRTTGVGDARGIIRALDLSSSYHTEFDIKMSENVFDKIIMLEKVEKFASASCLTMEWNYGNLIIKSWAHGLITSKVAGERIDHILATLFCHCMKKMRIKFRSLSFRSCRFENFVMDKPVVSAGIIAFRNNLKQIFLSRSSGFWDYPYDNLIKYDNVAEFVVETLVLNDMVFIEDEFNTDYYFYVRRGGLVYGFFVVVIPANSRSFNNFRHRVADILSENSPCPDCAFADDILRMAILVKLGLKPIGSVITLPLPPPLPLETVFFKT